MSPNFRFLNYENLIFIAFIYTKSKFQLSRLKSAPIPIKIFLHTHPTPRVFHLFRKTCTLTLTYVNVLPIETSQTLPIKKVFVAYNYKKLIVRDSNSDKSFDGNTRKKIIIPNHCCYMVLGK